MSGGAATVAATSAAVSAPKRVLTASLDSSLAHLTCSFLGDNAPWLEWYSAIVWWDAEADDRAIEWSDAHLRRHMKQYIGTHIALRKSVSTVSVPAHSAAASVADAHSAPVVAESARSEAVHARHGTRLDMDALGMKAAYDSAVITGGVLVDVAHRGSNAATEHKRDIDMILFNHERYRWGGPECTLHRFNGPVKEGDLRALINDTLSTGSSAWSSQWLRLMDDRASHAYGFCPAMAWSVVLACAPPCTRDINIIQIRRWTGDGGDDSADALVRSFDFRFLRGWWRMPNATHADGVLHLLDRRALWSLESECMVDGSVVKSYHSLPLRTQRRVRKYIDRGATIHFADVNLTVVGQDFQDRMCQWGGPGPERQIERCDAVLADLAEFDGKSMFDVIRLVVRRASLFETSHQTEFFRTFAAASEASDVNHRGYTAFNPTERGMGTTTCLAVCAMARAITEMKQQMSASSSDAKAAITIGIVISGRPLEERYMTAILRNLTDAVFGTANPPIHFRIFSLLALYRDLDGDIEVDRLVTPTTVTFPFTVFVDALASPCLLATLGVRGGRASDPHPFNVVSARAVFCFCHEIVSPAVSTCAIAPASVPASATASAQAPTAARPSVRYAGSKRARDPDSDSDSISVSP